MLKVKLEYYLNDEKLEKMLEEYNEEHEEKLILDEYIALLENSPEELAEYCENMVPPRNIDIKGYGQHDKRWWE